MQFDDKLFSKIRDELDELDKKREIILPETRNIIRNCSEIIKKVHRDEFEGLEEMIAKTKGMISNIKSKASETSKMIGKRYLITANQEFTEAAVLYNFTAGKKIPDYKELNVSAYEYIMGLADVVGELKRMVLNLVRKDDFNKAEEVYEFMEELYSTLFSLDYPSGLLPGFRKKVDMNRNLVSRTLELIVTSKKIHELNENLKNK